MRASTNLQRKTLKQVTKYRNSLERYIERHPLFLSAMEPIPIDKDAPRIVKSMADAADKTGTGPMASVAGAIAEFVGTALLPFSPEIIIENGGDIFLKSLKKRGIGIYAGQSPLTGKIGLEIDPQDTPMGVCTSSGTVGHSLSRGRADAVVVLSPSPTLADAAATAIGNIIKQKEDISTGIQLAKDIKGLSGLLAIVDDKVGLWGNASICKTG